MPPKKNNNNPAKNKNNSNNNNNKNNNNNNKFGNNGPIKNRNNNNNNGSRNNNNGSNNKNNNQGKIYLSRADYEKDVKKGLVPPLPNPNQKGKGVQTPQQGKPKFGQMPQVQGKGNRVHNVKGAGKGGKGTLQNQGKGVNVNRGKGGRESNSRMQVDAPAPYPQRVIQRQQQSQVLNRPITHTGFQTKLAAQMATANAIISSGTHPKQSEVRDLLAVREKGWIDDIKFVELLQQILFGV